MNRRRGEGTVEQRGRVFRVRLRHKDLGTYSTEEEANGVLDAAVNILADGEMVPADGLTFVAYATRWLDRREVLKEVRSATNDRRNFRKHLATAPFAEKPLTAISRRDVKEWLHVMVLKKHPLRPKQPLSRNTVHHVLALLKGILGAALDDELVRENPAKSVKVPGKDANTGEKWSYLTNEEQERIAACTDIPEHARLFMRFAWLSGLRSGELTSLRLADLRLDEARLTVRYSADDEPRKNNEMLEARLFPQTVEVLRRWLELLPTFAPKNPEGLIFPTSTGARRESGRLLGCDNVPKAPDADGLVKYAKEFRFARYLKMAGITKRVRFHDLRHTSAAALVSGTWDESWSLPMVGRHLGHKSLQSTQRYAHIADDAYSAAAARTAPARARRTATPRSPKPAGASDGTQLGPRAEGAGLANHLVCRVGRQGLEPLPAGG